MAAASPSSVNEMGPDEILGLCVTIASITLGAFGFMYAAYSATKLSGKTTYITQDLRIFCGLVAFILLILCVVAVLLAISVKATWPVWIIIICLSAVCTAAAYLAVRMEE